jgi:hypothetical protein
MRFLLAVGLYLVLTGFAVTDVLNRPEREPFGIHRMLWVAIIIVIPYVGALVWIVLRRREGTQPRPSRSRAPDDDPEYLSWVARQQRRRRQQRGDG